MSKINTFTGLKQSIGMSQIKYDVLDKLFSKIEIESDTVVFHVDLYTIICRCYSMQNLEKLSRADSTAMMVDFVVGIMNCLGHYRFYTVNRLHRKSVIILTCDRGLTEVQQKYYPNYRWDRIQMLEPDGAYESVNKIAYNAYRFVKTLCTYLDGIYVVDYNTGLDSLTCSYILRDMKFQNAFHIIFTRNMSAVQMINRNTVILHNTKTDHAVLLDKENYLADGIMKNQPMRTRKRFYGKVPPSLSPHIMILGGCNHVMKPFHHMPMKEAAYAVQWLYEHGHIPKNVSIQTFLRELEEYQLEIGEHDADIDSDLDEEHPVFYEAKDYNALIDRFRVISIQLNAAIATKGQLLQLESSIVDLYNQEYLDQISDMLARINDPDRLIDFGRLNANKPYRDEYCGEWW